MNFCFFSSFFSVFIKISIFFLNIFGGEIIKVRFAQKYQTQKFLQKKKTYSVAISKEKTKINVKCEDKKKMKILSDKIIAVKKS